MDTVQRPTPCIDDPDTGGFFAAAARGELAVRACRDCATVLHMPKSFCHGCGGWDTDWRVIAPTGVLWTFTRTDRQLHPAFPAPHTLVVVELDDAPGARLLGFLPGAPELRIGMPMRATFEEVDDEATIVQWEPAS